MHQKVIRHELGDFTMTPRALSISGLAIVIGFASAYIALALLRLIGIFTNLFFFQRWGTSLVSPAANHLGLLGGCGAGGRRADRRTDGRYGSDRIRGHGIPEAIEAILMNGSKLEPKVAILKPLSSAISIGSGGPFGAEGPIIMTGGAFGSMIAQLFRLTATERKTLLVAGAAAGMSATFAAPVAAVLLAVELLLFEWKPRSLIPVALASVTADAARRYLLGFGPLFPTPAHPVFVGPQGLVGCVVAGVLAGALSATAYDGRLRFRRSVRETADPLDVVARARRTGHRFGGLIFPQALGVGYDTIGALLQGDVPRKLIIGILLVKSVIWAVSLGSGHFRRSAGSAAHDGRRVRRHGSHVSAARRRRLLAPGQHGGGAGRDYARALHGRHFRARTDARYEHAAAAASGRDVVLRVHRAHDAPLHPDREGGPPRLSPELRICRGPAGDSLRPGSDAHQHCGASGP